MSLAPLSILRERRPIAVLAVAFGVAMALVVATPATASGRSKWAPRIRVAAVVNDDGRLAHADPGDVGGTSDGYDRWGSASSDDPTAAGMDAPRIAFDVARCHTTFTRNRLIVTIDNGYPGYVCSFYIKTISRWGRGLVVDTVEVDADEGLDVVAIGPTPQSGSFGGRQRIVASYAVEVLQTAPGSEELGFDIRISYKSGGSCCSLPPKCGNRSWR